ncbi:MAG: alpha/beta hydrolase, partial [Candidatus Pacebacteria bacterium]|nr:alpha/beta hydrolase [Candidatus Paceibacterota bacterium]
MIEEKTKIEGLTIGYRAFGSFPEALEGRSILVLHGWGVGSRSWVEFGELMAKAGYRVIVPDLPGFGQSQEPKTPWYFDDYIRFVEQFCAAMKLDKFYLIGHSFGGALACKFAATHPEMVEKLVLCDAAIIRKERLDWRQQYAKKMAAFKHRLLELPFAGGIYPLAKKILYKFVGSRDYELASPVMKETFKMVLATDTLEYARKLAVPTLVVWGDQDKSTPVEDAYELNKEIPGSVLWIIPGAGHKVHRTHAHQLAEAVNRFLADKSCVR